MQDDDDKLVVMDTWGVTVCTPLADGMTNLVASVGDSRTAANRFDVHMNADMHDGTIYSFSNDGQLVRIGGNVAPVEPVTPSTPPLADHRWTFTDDISTYASRPTAADEGSATKDYFLPFYPSAVGGRGPTAFEDSAVAFLAWGVDIQFGGIGTWNGVSGNGDSNYVRQQAPQHGCRTLCLATPSIDSVLYTVR